MSILCSVLDLWCCVVTLCDVVRHQTKNALCPFIHGRHKIEMLDEEKIEDNFLSHICAKTSANETLSCVIFCFLICSSSIRRKDENEFTPQMKCGFGM